MLDLCATWVFPVSRQIAGLHPLLHLCSLMTFACSHPWHIASPVLSHVCVCFGFGSTGPDPGAATQLPPARIGMMDLVQCDTTKHTENVPISVTLAKNTYKCHKFVRKRHTASQARMSAMHFTELRTLHVWTRAKNSSGTGNE